MKTHLRAYADSEGPDQPARCPLIESLGTVEQYSKFSDQTIAIRWPMWISAVYIYPKTLFFLISRLMCTNQQSHNIETTLF